MVKHVRIGILDMGSNAIRFSIVEASGAQHQTIESQRLPVRLGDHVFRTGRIPESIIIDTVDAFRRFRASCDRLLVSRTRTIATSAMREANNSDELLGRVRESSGFEIDIITGDEEAHLLKLGVETTIDLSIGRSMLIDVGGGSVEIAVVANGVVQNADSYPLGALRLGEMFHDAAPDQFLGLVRQHLKGLDRRFAEQIEGHDIDRCVGVGGNIDCLSDLITARVTAAKAQTIENCELNDLREELGSLAMLSIDERIAQRGLRPDRADTIVPAGAVYIHLAELAKATRIVVARTGIMAGLITTAR
jgi:exopolyphosphatase / guanosine-5'-triphosphate,3'-diphosphate pyrophosphatase